MYTFLRRGCVVAGIANGFGGGEASHGDVLSSGVKFLHAAFVSAKEVLAVGTFVGHRVERFDAARYTGAQPQPNDAENSGKDPSQRSRLRLDAGLDLALTVRAHHVDRVGTVVGRVDHHDHLLGSWWTSRHRAASLHVGCCAGWRHACAWRCHVGLGRCSNRNGSRNGSPLHLMRWWRHCKSSGCSCWALSNRVIV